MRFGLLDLVLYENIRKELEKGGKKRKGYKNLLGLKTLPFNSNIPCLKC